MPAFAAQYQFAAAFTVFLVALAGLALVALRSDTLTTRPGARAALGSGFLAVGTAAFVQGSLLVDDRADVRLQALRAAGVVAVFLGSIHWRGSRLSRSTLWGGLGGLLVAVPLEAADLSAASVVASVLGALLVAAALLNVSRRAVAARVAASAAATLLLVVLVLSVALSILLVNNVEDQAVGDLDSGAIQEATAIENLNRDAITDAAVVSQLLALLQANPNDPASPRLLAQLDPGGNVTQGQRTAIEGQLHNARAGIYFNEVAFGYVSEQRRVIAADGLDPGLLVPIAGSQVVQETLGSETGKGSTQVLDGNAFMVASAPIRLRSAGGTVVPFGAVVAVVPLDRHYLEVRPRDGDSLAIITRDGVASKLGPLPPAPTLTRLTGEVLAGRKRVVAISDGRFTVARAVLAADQRPILALVASRSSRDVQRTRDQLFRTFFVIAFGGTVLALLLAAIVGDRIGGGIRRLTTAAEAIQSGDFGVRSGIRSEDEVGVLGATFDSMAASIEEQTGALAEAAARVRAIVGGMGEALVAVDAEAGITDFNAAAEDLVGVDAASARGQRVDTVLRMTSEEGADLSARLRRLETVRWSALGSLHVDDGADVPVALTAAALRGPDESVTGGVIVLRDLRGEREVERMKRHFLSRVGHELRTPLTPLIGYSQLLAGRELPVERARPVYASILNSARRLERIVEMLEFFASLDAGRDVLLPERVDVRGVLGDVVSAWSAKVGPAHSITKRIARDTPAVSADPRWLGRSVDELVDNAVKFSPKGGRVTVAAGPAEEREGFVEISVRDVGVGMSDAQVERAFTEWSQGDESDTRSYGGLGLGLALVQRVAERHGGEVVCSTTPGKGSKFSILLPVLPTQEDGASRPDSGDRPLRRSRRQRVPDGGAAGG